MRARFGRVGLGYVGYIWAILGCSFLAFFVGCLGVALYLIGKRAERARPRTSVQSVPISARAASGSTPSDDAA